MKKRDIASWVFVGAFLVMCLVPALGTAIFGAGPAMANETPVTKPEIADGSGVNFALLSDVRDYVDGGFFGRAQLITLGRRLSAGVLGATDSKLVTTGRDGWLFYGETLDDYAGVNGLSPRELFAAAENIRLMDEYCRNEGVDFVFTLAPNKNSLYPEYMRFAPRGDKRDGERLYELLEGMGVRYSDLSEAFEERDETLYFAHDSHWTSRGAALAADTLIGALGGESRFFEGEFTASEHTGDLFEMLYPAARDRETDSVPVNAPEYTFGEGGTQPDSITINTQSSGEGTLLCYRDSFGNALYPYLASYFGEARFSRSPSYDMRLATQLEADAVIVELVERNLGYLLDYPPVLTAPERDLELPEETRGSLRVYAANDETPGLAVISGTLPEEADETSPVYISNGDKVYEAALTREGFTALLPAGEGPWRVAFWTGGELAAYEAR